MLAGMKRAMAVPALVAGLSMLAGCGSASPDCATVSVLTVGPGAATVSSAAAAPENQVHFQVSSSARLVDAKAACAVPANSALVHATWTNPDTVHIAISSADDATNGLAVCKGPTAGAVTLTASFGTGTAAQAATAQLTCQ